MKRKIALIAALSAAGLALAGPDVVVDDKMGLSPVSVFDTPAPAVFQHRTQPPKESGVLPRFWEGAPPQTPHHMEKFLPINAKTNKCLECHDEPDNMGKKVKGKPTPMPETHYAKVDGELALSSKRYVCTLCHAPQAEVNTLVGNSYRSE